MQLPYLNEVTFTFAGSEDNQILRFANGESDLVTRIGPRNFAALERDPKRGEFNLVNAGPTLEYSFLFFNLGEPPAGGRSIAPHLACLHATPPGGAAADLRGAALAGT